MVVEEILQVPSPGEMESFLNIKGYVFYLGFPGVAVLKNLPASAGGTGDSSSIPGSRDPPEKETATCSSILAREIPWTEESGGL